MTLAAYPSVRPSGVRWLGAIPTHWEVGQSRRLFAERKERARDGDTQLTASQKHGVISQERFMELEGQKVVQVVQGHDILKHVELGDFVISMRSFQGGLEMAKERGCISSAYVPLVATREGERGYFSYLFKSQPYIQALQSTSNLVRDGQAMRFANFALVDLPIVPHEDQRAIASFLDRETGKIDALVEEQRRLVELLNQRITASVAYRGEIAGKAMRLEHAVEIISRPAPLEQGEAYASLGLFNRGRGLFRKDAKDAEEMGASDFFWVEPGDLIISGQFAWEGAVALVEESERGCVVSHRYPVVRGKEGVVLTEYLYAFLLTKHGNFLMAENSRGAAGRNRPLNLQALLREEIFLPGVEVQGQVAEAIRQRSLVVSEINRQIALLLERRSALISTAVTGKIDVRGAAMAASSAA